MSNLGISIYVTPDPNLSREEWSWHNEYWVQLSWGEVVGGTGYEGLVAALRGLRHEFELALSEDAEEQERLQIEDKIAELKAYVEDYLSTQKNIAAEAHSKVILALTAFLDSANLDEKMITEGTEVALEVRFIDYVEVAATLEIGGNEQEADSLDDLLSTMLPGVLAI